MERGVVATAVAAAAAGMTRLNCEQRSVIKKRSITSNLIFSEIRGFKSVVQQTKRSSYWILPTFKALASPSVVVVEDDYAPDAPFYKVEAILRPWRVQQVSSALLKMGIRGVTVSDVRGFGAQGGSTERQAGSEFSEDTFVAKVKMEIVVNTDQVEAVVGKIIDEARTGEIGDGKIFLVPIADVIRVRTGERGAMAERMSGGRSDMHSIS